VPLGEGSFCKEQESHRRRAPNLPALLVTPNERRRNDQREGDPPTRCSSPLLENVRRLHWDFGTRKYHNNGICTRCKPATEFLGALRSLEELELWNTTGYLYMKDVADALAPHGRIRSLRIFGDYYSTDTFLADVSRLTSLEKLGLFAGPDLAERSILLLSRLKGLQSLSFRLECNLFSCDGGARQVAVLESLSQTFYSHSF
jgi:hypothetical protein